MKTYIHTIYTIFCRFKNVQQAFYVLTAIKSKGALTLHRRKKPVDGVFSASSTEPGQPEQAKRDWNKLAKENLSCKRLCDLVEETKAELTRNNLYPEEFVKEIKDSPQFTCSEKDDLYKEIIKLLKIMLKKGNAEKYYKTFYSSLMLRAQSLLKHTYRDDISKVLMMYIADKIMSVVKKSLSSESVQQDRMVNKSQSKTLSVGELFDRLLHSNLISKVQKT